MTFLKEQHQQVKALFERVTTVRGKAREEAFYDLRRMLAVHETAEEEVVHPVARRVLPRGDAIIGARLHEEHEAKKTLAELEKLECETPQFEQKLRVLKAAVIAHADAEEREEFDALAGDLEPERLERMRKMAELAEAIAPTRPHPGVESAIANLFAGPFASMVDRVRDAVAGKHH